MPSSVVAAAGDVAAPNRGRAHVVAQLLSVAPLWILLAVAADPQAHLFALVQPAPAAFGVPLDVLVTIATLGWMAVGAALIHVARSPLAESLALLLFTIPATIAAVLAPALLPVLVPAV